jgi:hypothetical protein
MSASPDYLVGHCLNVYLTLHTLLYPRQFRLTSCRHAVGHSVASFYRPYAALTDGDGLPLRYSIPAAFDTDPSVYSMLDICQSLHLSRDVLELLSDLCHYGACLRLWFEVSCQGVDALDLQTQSCMLEHRLIQYITRAAELLNAMEVILCLACLIFVVKCSEPDGQSFDPLHFTVLPRLQSLIDLHRVDWMEFPKELQLWIHVVGALSARGAVEARTYVNLVRADVQSLKITSFEDLLNHLHRCLWVNQKLCKDTRWLWDELQC